MPFTPFHFGPGFFIKLVLFRWFSFRVFILANVIIDLEPLYFMLTNQWPLHRFLHTYLGATVVAIGCIALGRPICYWLTDVWNMIFKGFKIANGKISTTALVVGVFIGTYSHVFIDSIIHSDMRPLFPLTGSNYLLHALNYEQLHLLCVLSGVLGVVFYYCIRKR